VSYRFRPAARPEDRGAQPPHFRRASVDGMIVEPDVAVPVRGAITVYADVFRPADGRPAPPLIAWSPYGKHAEGQLPLRYPDSGVAPGQLSPYTAFESPDPGYWTARGYAVGWISRSCPRGPGSSPASRCAWSSRGATSTVSPGRSPRRSMTSRSTTVGT